MDVVDPLARAGFGSGAGAYEQGRPGYPAAAVAWLAAHLGITPGRRVVDVGAGTGKLTRSLVALGADVVAVEPVAEMRARLERSVPSVEAIDGVAEDIPLPDASVDAVLCGEAFHWFDGTAALAEFHRVLRRGAGVGLVWNVHAWDRGAGWVQAIERLLAPYSDGRAATRYLSGEWCRAFAATSVFGPVEGRSFRHRLRLDRAGLIAHVASVAFIAALPSAERERVLTRMKAVIDSDPALAGAASVTIPYRTDAYAVVTAG